MCWYRQGVWCCGCGAIVVRGCLAGCPCSAFSWQLAVFPRVVGVCFWGACFRVPFFMLVVLLFSRFFASLFCPFLISLALLVPVFVCISLMLAYFQVNPLFYLYTIYFAIKKSNCLISRFCQVGLVTNTKMVEHPQRFVDSPGIKFQLLNHPPFISTSMDTRAKHRQEFHDT